MSHISLKSYSVEYAFALDIIKNRVDKMDSCHIIVAEKQALLGVLIELTIQQSYPKARVSTVTDGQEALQVYKQRGADLIITDKRVPTLDGFELTRNLRAQGATLPIIILSEDPSGEKEAEEVGATMLMRKLGLTNLLPLVLYRLLPSQILPGR